MTPMPATPLALRRRALLRLTLASLAAAPFLRTTARADEAPPPDLDALARACNAFAIDLHRALVGPDAGDRFLSPFSVATALGMTLLGARGETAAEMARVLRLGDRDHEALGALAADLGRSDDWRLAAGNRLFADRAFALHPAFVARCSAAYGADVGRVDFAGAPDAARGEVNAWVAGRTNDRIRDLLRGDDVTKDTRLVLVNAVHFKAAWQHPFLVEATRPGPFTLASGEQVQAPLMNRAGRCRVADLDGATALELDYAGERLALLCLIPSGAGGLADLERGLSADSLARAVAALRDEHAALVLPRFRIDDRAQLAAPLRELGMPRAFTAAADFSGMTPEAGIAIARVVHQTFVDVTEAGTEAAAATGVVMTPTGAPRPPARTVRADRPFLFLIRDRRSGVVLFLGRLTDPR